MRKSYHVIRTFPGATAKGETVLVSADTFEIAKREAQAAYRVASEGATYVVRHMGLDVWGPFTKGARS